MARAAFVVRNPGNAVQLSRKRHNVSRAARATQALKNAESRRRRALYEDDLDAFFAYREEEIARIANTHGKSDKVVRKVLCHKSHFKSERGLSLRNAINHDRAVKAREAGGKLDWDGYQEELRNDIEEGLVNVTKESLGQAEYKRLMDQLQDHRETKRRGMRLTNKAAATDARQTVQQMQKSASGLTQRPASFVLISRQLINLHERTGVRAFAFFTRGNADDAALPAYIDSDNALDFFPQVMSQTTIDVCRKFESFSCTMDSSARDKNDLATMRSEISRYVQEGLCRITGNKNLKMAYVDYDGIREQHGVEMAGHPAEIPVVSPANHSIDIARRLRDMWRAGEIKWAHMTKRQREELAAEREAKRAENGGVLRKRATRSDSGVPRGPRKEKTVDRGEETEPAITLHGASSVLAAGAGSSLAPPSLTPIPFAPTSSALAVGASGLNSASVPIPFGSASNAAMLDGDGAASVNVDAITLGGEGLVGVPAFTLPTIDLDIDLIDQELRMAGFPVLNFPAQSFIPDHLTHGTFTTAYDGTPTNGAALPMPLNAPFELTTSIPSPLTPIPAPLTPIPTPLNAPSTAANAGTKRHAKSMNKGSDGPAGKRARAENAAPAANAPKLRKKRSDAGIKRGPRK